MSYWFYKKDKCGKKDLYAVDFPYVAIMPFLGMLAALLIPHYLNLNNLIKDCFYLISVGFFLLLISKISLFSKRVWNSWGPKHMSKTFRLLYITGYILIGIGVVIGLILSSAILNH
jgi:hypothetical protein